MATEKVVTTPTASRPKLPPHALAGDETEPRIPTFSADGSRVRAQFLSKVEAFLAAGAMVVRRNRKGKITCAQYRVQIDGANPLRRSAHVGTRYSWLEHVGEDSPYRAWRHRNLLQSQYVEVLMGQPVDNPEDIDLFVRAVFRAVPLSCMKRPARTPLAPVIPIDSFRPKRKQKPWEPDPPAAKVA